MIPAPVVVTLRETPGGEGWRWIESAEERRTFHELFTYARGEMDRASETIGEPMFVKYDFQSRTLEGRVCVIGALALLPGAPRVPEGE